MTTTNRSIRGTLDASSGVDSSHSVGIITRIVDAVTNQLITNLQSTGTPLAQAISQSGYISIQMMRDVTGGISTTPTNFSGSAPTGSLPAGHGINLVDNEKLSSPSSNVTPNGFGQANVTFGSGNQGLMHYAHTVQFGKGAAQNTLIGLNNNNNQGFLVGGTNLPEVFGSNVFFTNNTYRSVNIKMSEFHDVTKIDPPNVLGYINNDGQDEETGGGVDEGLTPISIGNAANGPI
tara:strand:- start:720 stop:1421 length:702 start_codon:yes stop_codon:yes gene_type:complete